MAVRKKQAEIEAAQDAEFAERDLRRIKRARGPLEPHHIKLYRDDWRALQEHFQDQGVSTAAGIRQILWGYMRDKGI